MAISNHDGDLERRNRISTLVSKGRLGQALEEAAALPGRNVAADVRPLTESYGLLTEYALNGVDDPKRGEMLAELGQKTIDVADAWLRRRLAIDAPKLYYSTLRIEAQRRDDSLASLVKDAQGELDRLGLALLSGEPRPLDPATGRPMRETLEALWVRVFNRVWVKHPLSVDDQALLLDVIAGSRFPEPMRINLLWAVTLGGLEWRDNRRIDILMEVYGNVGLSQSVRLAALIGLVCLLARFPERPLRRKSQVRLAALAELPGWEADLREVVMQLISARDTERISRKIRDELIPNLMKLSPELRRQAEQEGGINLPNPMEENPEWEELLEKSGLGKQLRELGALQEEGGDVMMATFSHLKSFPFFGDVANWFLPYHADHTLVAKAADASGLHGFFTTLESSVLLCDSDKFSMVFALGQTGRDRMQGMVDMLEQAGRQEMDDLRDNLREAVVRSYVRTLYRFFKLFRRKGEFDDIFALPLDPTTLPQEMARVFAGDDMVRLIAEFYFRRGYYPEALSLFGRLSPDVEICQKMGFAHQQAGRLEEALALYEQSELLASEPSRWTLRRLASVSRMLGYDERALGYLNRLSADRPNDASLALQTADCLLDLGRVDEAVNQYFKVEFLDDSRPERYQRRLAWALTLQGNLDQARAYSDRVLAGELLPADLLNRGHLELLSGHPRDAVEFYVRAIEKLDFDAEKFMEQFDADLPQMQQRGVDPLIARIAADRALDRARALGNRWPS